MLADGKIALRSAVRAALKMSAWTKNGKAGQIRLRRGRRDDSSHKCRFSESFKQHVSSLVKAATTALCLLWSSPTVALENLKLVRGVLILEGRIESGDYVSVRNFLSDASNFRKMNGQVFLASQGGDAFEALQIGYVIRRLRLSTDAPSRPPPTTKSSGSEIIHPFELTNPRVNYLCTSACFLLYVAGVHREFIWAGRLGIHSPQVERKPIGVTEKDITIAAADMRNKLNEYFEQMNVPKKYLDSMYSVPSNEVRWITQSEFNADLKGYVPEVQALLDAKCNSTLAVSTDIQKCIVQITAELRNEAWLKLFNRD